MTTKTYKSRTCIAINVVLASKKNRHISFEPCTDGSSTFTTTSSDIQDAIEKHYNYNKLFFLESSIVEKEDEKKSEKTTETGDGVDEPTGDDEPKDTKPTGDDEPKDTKPTGDDVKKVDISDIEAAKDYIADTFNISRTLLRSKKAIIEQAKAHNIEFVGL